jgi:hypothetical protein
MKKTFRIIVLFLLDFVSLIKKQEECDIYDMLQVVAFGMLINALYGVMHSLNVGDLIITLMSSYGIMRFRKDIKDNKC